MIASNLENPFSDYGNIVSGDRFLGRHDDLRIIENRIIRPRNPGNLAIIGDYRIGKSSLIYKAIMERKEELLKKKLVPIWINLGTCDKGLMLFNLLVTRCYDELEKLAWLSEPVKYAKDHFSQAGLTWVEIYGRIQRFFEKIRQAGLHIIFILDEFDYARSLFREDISGFQGLRELSYRPEWRITYITTSRRTLRNIELQTKAISTFDLIFHKHYLTMFNDSDMQEYFSRLTSLGIDHSHLSQEKIRYYCGCHPYLLEMLGYEIVDLFMDKQVVDIDQSAHRVARSFVDQYEHMINILEEDGRLNKLLQILFGPVVDVNSIDEDEFLRYGLIKLNDQGSYVAFSPHFQTYLKLIERHIDLWPLWRQTEITLRQVTTGTMLEKYGEHWLEILEKARPHLKSIFEKCREAQQREARSFGSRASHNLIDFTYPQDLFSIIFAEWQTFKSIFGKDQNYWGQRSQLLGRIRNPLAHNRDEALYDYERQIVEGYCKEILITLKQ